MRRMKAFILRFHGALPAALAVFAFAVPETSRPERQDEIAE
jgi:hypothetical protein